MSVMFEGQQKKNNVGRAGNEQDKSRGDLSERHQREHSSLAIQEISEQDSHQGNNNESDKTLASRFSESK